MSHFFGAQRFGRLLGQEHLAREIGGIFRWTGLTLTEENPQFQASAFWGKFLANSIENWRYWNLWNARISKEHTFNKEYWGIINHDMLEHIDDSTATGLILQWLQSPIKNWVTPMAMEGFQSLHREEVTAPLTRQIYEDQWCQVNPFHFQKPLLVYNRISSYFFQLYFGYREVLFFSPH